MNKEEVLSRLHSMANPDNVAGMARYGISSQGTLGVSIPALRALAKEIGSDHALARAVGDRHPRGAHPGGLRR